jgi:flavin-dependent dehydrogenase
MTVSATLSASDASQRDWDAVIVGAGCAGGMAALDLAARGLSTLLVDKAQFPRWKVCGCCLNRRALDTLAAAGLSEVVSALGAVSLTAFRLGAHGRETTVPLPEHRALSREALDAALINAASASGAHFLPGCRATLEASGASESRTVLLRHGDSQTRVRTRLVLAADGLGGKLAGSDSGFTFAVRPSSRIGAGTVLDGQPDDFAPGVVHMACGRGGYVGAVRLEDGRLDVAAAFDPAWVKQTGGLHEAARFTLDEAGFPPLTNPEDGRWRGTPALTRTATRVAGHRVFVLGDSAGYVEPFTGEGMAWALSAGRAVGPLAEQAATEWSPSLASRWEDTLHRVVRRRQHLCRIVAAGLRRPRVAGWSVTALEAMPFLAAPLVRRMNAAVSMEQ